MHMHVVALAVLTQQTSQGLVEFMWYSAKKVQALF